jgi:hypothetical protein
VDGEELKKFLVFNEDECQQGMSQKL